MSDSAEQGEPCPVCEGLDQPGLLHNVNAPYCSASTEQGDVETMILSALGLTSEELNEGERGRLAAVIDQFAAALERVERERDRLDDLFPGSGAVTTHWQTWRSQMTLGVP